MGDIRDRPGAGRQARGWRSWTLHSKILLAVLGVDVAAALIGIHTLPIKDKLYDYYYFDGPMGKIDVEFVVLVTIYCLTALVLWALLAFLDRLLGRMRTKAALPGWRQKLPSWLGTYRKIHVVLLYAAVIYALIGPLRFSAFDEFEIFLPRYGIKMYLSDVLTLAAAVSSVAVALFLVRSGGRTRASREELSAEFLARGSAEEDLAELFKMAEAVERDVVDMKQRLTTSLERLTLGTRRVETELKARRAKMEELAVEAEQYQQTAKLHKETSDAVRDFLTAKVSEQLMVIDKNSRRSQVLYFAAGVLVSIPIGVVINLATK